MEIIKYFSFLLLFSCGANSTTHKIDFSLCTAYENEEAQKECFEILKAKGK